MWKIGNLGWGAAWRLPRRSVFLSWKIHCFSRVWDASEASRPLTACPRGPSPSPCGGAWA
ncbi:hypothetical protein E2C01_079801 [Portunus trituberculatus]|uniref:Uncharacterized protein n=1 Tax=Portunus trituberculatus TaxID=210409 RepID=A0A5B7IRS2_PORTR|nr:hypothetical protein [Portunus trituberculatus]